MNRLWKSFGVAVFSVGLPVASSAAPAASHSIFADVWPYDYENGNWLFGCAVFDKSTSEEDFPYRVFVNVCWVQALPSSSGVEQFGFNFNASGMRHWGVQAATPAAIPQPGSWYTTSQPQEVDEDIRAISSDLITSQKLNWDQLGFNWYFWYKLQNDSTYYDAGGQDSNAKSNFVGL